MPATIAVPFARNVSGGGDSFTAVPATAAGEGVPVRTPGTTLARGTASAMAGLRRRR